MLRISQHIFVPLPRFSLLFTVENNHLHMNSSLQFTCGTSVLMQHRLTSFLNQTIQYFVYHLNNSLFKYALAAVKDYITQKFWLKIKFLLIKIYIQIIDISIAMLMWGNPHTLFYVNNCSRHVDLLFMKPLPLLHMC